ncbi:MAG TPA: MFS transporter, partial [Clostridiales bacterium]|nr:MFS transporter [Clostridiales bacterium]
AAWLVSLRFIPRKPLQLKGIDHRSLDLPGGILYIMTITSLIFGLSMITRLAVARYLLLLSPLCFVLFVRHERRSASPIIQIELFRRDRIYMLSNLAALLNYGATFAVGYLLSIYLQVVRGFDASLSGFILISQPLIMAVLSPLTGRLSDRISPYKLASLGMAFCAAGLVALGFIRPDYPLFLLVVVLVLIGISFALFSSPNTNAVMSRVPPKDYGVASSVLATMRTIGQSSGLATISFIFAIRVGNIPLHSVPTGMLISAMSLAFLIFSAVCAVGIFCSMSRKSQDN